MYTLREDRRAKVIGLILISPVGIPEKPPGWTPKVPFVFKPLIWVSEALNLTPMSFARGAGPLGPYARKELISIHIYLKDDSLYDFFFSVFYLYIRSRLVARFRTMMADRYIGFYPDHRNTVNAYSYHVNAQAGAGEFACKDLLLFAYAYKPLIHRIEEIDECPTGIFCVF